MEKHIKDYISLYIGCEIQTPDCIGVNLGLYYADEIGYFNGVNIRYPNGKVYVQNYNQVKPILRPLSDMTEEDEEVTGLNPTYEFGHHVFSPDEFLYFISKAFDIFGLIDEGLAIDKTTLK